MLDHRGNARGRRMIFTPHSGARNKIRLTGPLHILKVSELTRLTSNFPPLISRLTLSAISADNHRSRARALSRSSPCISLASLRACSYVLGRCHAMAASPYSPSPRPLRYHASTPRHEYSSSAAFASRWPRISIIVIATTSPVTTKSVSQS